jgi:hypothetical protein
MFSEGEKCYWCRDCRLVRVYNIYLSFSTRSSFIFIVWYAFVIWYAFGRVFAIIGLRTSSGLISRRLIKRIILRNRRKNP